MLDPSPADQPFPPAALPTGGVLGALRRFGSIFGVSLLATLCLVAVLSYDLWRAYRDTEAQAYTETRSLVRVFEAHVDRDLEAIDDMLRTFAGRVAARDRVGPLDAGQVEEDARLLLQSLPAGGIVLISRDGTALASTLPGILRGRQLDEAGYFRRVADTQPSNDPIIDRLVSFAPGAPPVIPMSRGIYRTDGTLLGVAMATLRPTQFVNLFANLDAERYSALTISTDEGVIVARMPENNDLIGQSIAAGELYRNYLPVASAGSVHYRGVVFGRGLIMSYRHLAAWPFVVSAAFDSGEVFAPWYRLLANYLVLGAALTLAIGACAGLLARDQRRRQSLNAAQRIRAILDGTSSFVFLLSPDGTLLETNRTLLDRAGLIREEVVGRVLWGTVWCRHSSELQQKVKRMIDAAATGEVTRSDLSLSIGRERFITADTTFQRIEQPDGRHYIVASGVDVTDHRVIEEQLRQSQKMEAIGLLAGGIAHDFNNLLASVSHFAEFLSEDLAAGSTQHGFADRIRKACARGKDLVAQILTFAQPTTAERSGVDLAEIVAAVHELVQPSLPGAIEFECATCRPGTAIVLANRAQLTQIILNLCINAIDALEERAGVVRVAVELAEPGGGDALHPSGLADPAARYQSRPADPSQRYARISVRDTGSGIPPEVMHLIFDPFFSTKPRGRGTGLGLAVVHGIVGALDGIIEVESTPGSGTIFAVYLPLGREGATATQTAPEASRAARGSERILIVEDDIDLADALALGLDRAGYEVAVLHRPEEALAAVRDDPQAWSLLVTDHNLPIMSGLELAREIAALRPDLPVVLHTGMSDAAFERRARSAGVTEFLRKPATPAELAVLVRSVLDRPRTVAAASHRR